MYCGLINKFFDPVLCMLAYQYLTEVKLFLDLAIQLHVWSLKQ